MDLEPLLNPLGPPESEDNKGLERNISPSSAFSLIIGGFQSHYLSYIFWVMSPEQVAASCAMTSAVPQSRERKQKYGMSFQSETKHNISVLMQNHSTLSENSHSSD